WQMNTWSNRILKRLNTYHRGVTSLENCRWIAARRALEPRSRWVRRQLPLLVLLVALISVCWQPAPGYAQCSGTGAFTPVTWTYETGSIAGSRMLVNGPSTVVNNSTPGQTSIWILPTKRLGLWEPILTTSTTFTAVGITAPTATGTAANNSGSSGVLVKYT